MQVSGANNLNSALWTSASGLRDANIRAATVAHNVANMNTDGFVPDTVSSSADANGGVSTRIERPAQKDVTNVPREAVLSETDVATEMTNLVMAKRAYQANAVNFRELQDTAGSWKAVFGDENPKRA